MKFTWKDYKHEDAQVVDSWMDSSAVKALGLDISWNEYIKFMKEDSHTCDGVNYWCKMIYESGKAVAAISLLLLSDNTLSIGELIVDSERRGKGYGTIIIKELLENGKEIIGKDIIEAATLVFCNNIEAKKVFEKTGFHLDHVHPDGDSEIYKYKKE